jgi:O-succinylbenzoate synthase
VISAAFESGVGIRALAYLANFVMSPGVAAGLDTWRWLAEDVLDHDGSRCEAELRFGSVAT